MPTKGVWVQSAGALINALLSFALLLLLAQQLGPLAFGNYSVLLNAGVIALVAIEGGYPLLVYRETALVSAALAPWHERLLGLAVGGGLVVALALAVVPVGPWLGQNYADWWAVLVCMILVAWTNIHSGVLRGQGHFAVEAGWQVAARLCAMAAILAALVLGARSGTAVFLAWSLGLLLLIALRRPHRPPLPVFERAAPVRSVALHLMLGQLLFVALMRLDLLALAIIGEQPLQTAYYAAVARFAEAGFLLFAPVVNVLQLGFRQRLPDAPNFATFLRRMALGAMAFAMVGTLAGGMAAHWLVPLAFGTEYAQAAPLLVWVLASLVLMLPSQVLAQAAVALNGQRLVWIAYAVGLSVALAGAMAWVPSDGALGMAWAMLLGHGSVLLVLAFWLRKYWLQT
jgi:O-antigen/teichoic acid export membrane protein